MGKIFKWVTICSMVFLAEILISNSKVFAGCPKGSAGIVVQTIDYGWSLTGAHGGPNNYSCRSGEDYKEHRVFDKKTDKLVEYHVDKVAPLKNPIGHGLCEGLKWKSWPCPSGK